MAILAVLVAAVGTALIVTACLLIAAGVAVSYSLLLPGEYIYTMLIQADASPPEPEIVNETILARVFRLPFRADGEVAFPNYFSGPAEVDAKAIVIAATGRCSSRLAWAVEEAGGPSSDDGMIRGFIVFAGLWLGLIVGGIVGTILTIAVGVIHMAFMAAMVLMMVCVSFTLRGVDTAMRFFRGVVIRCPNSLCSRRIRPYPAYRCPDCQRLHRDIRPGPNGVIRRVCRCGYRMPTLLIMGSGRLAAVCQQCGQDLPAGIGTAPEIVIPVFGSMNAGKTQLVYMLTMAIQELAAEFHAVVKIDDDMRSRLDQVGRLAATGNMTPTPAKVPEPYIVRLKVGLDERIIYFFDAAGEMYHKLAPLEDLGYLDKGRTLIFVVDPLSSDVFWDQLNTEFKMNLADARSSIDDILIAYEQTREQMRRMGRRGKKIKFAFVVSKADLIKEATGAALPQGDVLTQIVVDPAGMDMGSLIREARQSFKSLDCFATAAITDSSGLVDESVRKLARWILGAEGVMLDHR
jgi:hypothetical protein